MLAGAPINCQNANLIVDHTAVCKKLNYYYLNNVENFGYRRVKVLVQRIVSGEETAVGGGVLCAERERERASGVFTMMNKVLVFAGRDILPRVWTRYASNLCSGEICNFQVGSCIVSLPVTFFNFSVVKFIC